LIITLFVKPSYTKITQSTTKYNRRVK
jgi:hypothetical protein